jgi:hypothetical protein
MRLIVIIPALASFLIAGIIIYGLNRPKPYPIEKWVKNAPTKRQLFREAFFVSLGVFEAIALISLPILSWQIYVVDGTFVITYANIVQIALFIGGFLVLRILVGYIRASPEKKRAFF